MKILLCHERFVPRYGVDRVLLALAREFRASGHHVTLLGLRFHTDTPAPICADRVIQLPPPASSLAADVEATVWLTQHWEEHFAGGNRPDIVLTAGWPFLSAIRVFESRGCRVVYQDHGIIPLDGMPEIGWRSLSLLENLKCLYLPAASAVVAVSAFLRDTQTQRIPGLRRPVEIIPNGIDHGPDAESGHAAGGETPVTSGRPVRLLSLGRFEPGTYKASEKLFVLEEQVRAWAPDAWIAAFAAPEALRDAAGAESQARIAALGHPGDEEMYAWMRSADVLVCLSTWEGFNLPLAEAQRLGRPCLVFDIGAHREVVADPWLLCASIEEMAAKARSLCEATAPRGLRDGSVFNTWASGPGRRWRDAAARYIELFTTVLATDPGGAHEPRSLAGAEGLADRRDLLLMDVTNATRDPANSGCLRVARRLAAEWQAYLRVVFVVWEREAEAFRFPTASEFERLGTYQGPRREDGHPVSTDAAPRWLEAWLGSQSPADPLVAPASHPREADRWLILPEIRHRPDLWPILEFAARARLRTASIFHDAIPVERPDLVPDPVYREGHADYMRGLGRVDVNLANSHASAAALREFWRAEHLSGRVAACVLPGGMGGTRPTLASDGTGTASTSSMPGAEPFILMVSTLEPRKGFRRLIEAFLAVREKTRRSDWRLVLVGSRSWWSNEIATSVEYAARAHTGIVWMENASDEVLTELYRTCAFTVYASEIEGFGLPILESIWHGRPCLCHAFGSMAELAAGGGCLSTDLMDPSAFRRALAQLMDDDGLRRRLEAECRARSIKQWPDFAAEFRARLALARWAELEPWQTEDGPVVEHGTPGRLSFILPTYNRLALLKECLGTLFPTLPVGLDLEFLIVDDHSSDGTFEWLTTEEITARGVRVLRNTTNRGYGASVNRAARVASGEILVLLNQDLRFRPGWLEPMLAAWRQHPHRFAVGNLQYSARDGALDHAGMVFTPSGHPEHFRADETLVHAMPVREFPAVTFACALVDRQRFLRLGGLDARFLNGSEDVDICLRARFQGWPSYVANASAVEHQISASPGRKLAEPENMRRFFGRWQMPAIVLGRDWEERLAWERARPAGRLPPDARPPGPPRVLVDLTPFASSAGRPIPADLWRELEALAAHAAAPCCMCLLVTPAQARDGGPVPGGLGLAAERGEIWQWREAPADPIGAEAGGAWVSGPAETLARRLEADVLYCPAGVSRFVAPGIPVVCRASGEVAPATMAFVAFRGEPDHVDDATRVRAAIERYRAAHVRWRWSENGRSSEAAPALRDHDEPSTVASDKLLFCIDEPVCWEEPVPMIEIRGWCVHVDGLPLSRVVVRTSGGALLEGVAQRRRPDVAAALPAYPTAATSGFSVRVPRGEWSDMELWVHSGPGQGFAARLRMWRNVASGVPANR